MFINRSEGYLVPAFQQNNVVVTVAASEAYAKYLFVLLESIRNNSSKNSNYDIIVLSDGISFKHKKALLNEMQQENLSVRFVEAGEWLENKSLYTAKHISRTTYLRLAAVDILSAYDKTIYLDCDMVVNRDIAELFAHDINHYMLAAVKDTVMWGWCCMQNSQGQLQRQYNREILNLSETHVYFNAGVMVMNLVAFRTEGLHSRKLIELATQKEWKWFDQDLLNSLCQDRILYLDPRWNVMVHPFEFEWQLAEFHMPGEEYASYWKNVVDPYIVHYAGQALPIYDPTVERSDLFWRYARRTSRYGQLQNDMRQRIVNQFGERSLIRKLADVFLPYGSKQRIFIRRLLGFNKRKKEHE